MSWRDVQPLDSPQYEALTSINRSVHLRDAMVCFGKKRLTSHKIQTRNAKVNGIKVLWFAPMKPMDQNNKYGNVSFNLSWSSALDQLGPYLYYIDQKKTPDIVYSRILLSNKCHSNLTLVNTNYARMPLLESGGRYHVATACNGVTHVVEIGIEADAKRGKRLYDNCKIQANDHSSGNTRQYPGGPYNSCICHRFNYFDKVCPNVYTAHQTRAILNKKCPTMLRDEPPWSYRQEAEAQMLHVTDEDEDDEDVYEDGQFIDNYDDQDHVSLQGYSFGTSRGGSSHSASARDTPSYGATYGSGAHGRPGDASSSGGRHMNAQVPGLQRTAPRQEQDEEWSTGSKVALVAGGLALFAGLAAAFTADSAKEDDKKKTKNWWE